MNITDVKIRKFLNDGRMKAIVSVTFDNEMAIHDIKVIEGPERLFVAMPSRKGEDGVFRDIAHPISPEARMELETVILNKFHEMLAQNAENMGEQIDVSESTGMDTNA